MFLHIGVLHVATNCYALWIVGQQVEKLYGTARFVAIYFLTGLAGSIVSYLAPTRGGPSAGASGAIFGLFGVLFVFGLRYRKELPGVFRQAFGARVLPTIGINLVITFALEFIDKGAHVGGLLAGMALAAVLPYARPGERRASVWWRIAAFVCVAATVASFVLAYRTPARTEDDLAVPGILVDESVPRERFIYRYNRSDKALGSAAQALATVGNGGPVPAGAAADAAAGAEDARKARGLDPQADALLDRQAALLTRATEILEAASAGRRPPRNEIEEVLKERDELDAAVKQWVEREGPQYGFEMRPHATPAP
jgi:membrane associated rhomboid family serine protease